MPTDTDPLATLIREVFGTAVPHSRIEAMREGLERLVETRLATQRGGRGMTYWNWEDGTPHERADMIRRHGLLGNALVDLFCLTDEGRAHILAGDIWRPEYSTRAEDAAACRARAAGATAGRM